MQHKTKILERIKHKINIMINPVSSMEVLSTFQGSTGNSKQGTTDFMSENTENGVQKVDDGQNLHPGQQQPPPQNRKITQKKFSRHFYGAHLSCY